MTAQLDVPSRTTVVVIGGGPGGSYTASVLAREGIDVVVLEAEKFPRYHVGESMLSAMRHLLRFVDLDETFDKYGFTRKNGAAFKLVPGGKQEGYTDFLAGGPDNYVWNVVRSQSDELLFRHAGASGAKIFDGHKVTDVVFDSITTRPIAAAWTTKTGKSGRINFDYLVDASGRSGLLSSRYLKTRNYNQGLKNIATWGYWRNVRTTYAVGTQRENSPFFEALTDESGWAWFIPLHAEVVSLGIVQHQDIISKKKRAMRDIGDGCCSTEDFYLSELRLAPEISAMLGNNGVLTPGPGELDGSVLVKSTSDYSYSASSYAGDGYRIVGDAGAFIDPFFSSGVHLAMTSGLTAATSICSSIKGELSEQECGDWHSKRVANAYTRFLLVVLGAYRQMQAQTQAVLSDVDEDNFDRAFAFFRPVIQGAVDVQEVISETKVKASSETEINNMVDFCAHVFDPIQPQDRDAVMEKVSSEENEESSTSSTHLLLTNEENAVLNFIHVRQSLRISNALDTSNFTTDIVNGLKTKPVGKHHDLMRLSISLSPFDFPPIYV